VLSYISYFRRDLDDHFAWNDQPRTVSRGQVLKAEVVQRLKQQRDCIRKQRRRKSCLAIITTERDGCCGSAEVVFSAILSIFTSPPGRSDAQSSGWGHSVYSN
jgi:hypothetical protein